MKKIIFTVILILICGILILNRYQKVLVKTGVQNVIITNQNNKDITVNVELATTPAEQAKGLSDRKILKVGSGMLFVFDNKQIMSFWMKNMNFPLDIIWLDDNQIIKISRNLPPEGEKPISIYSSDVPVNYVLEVPAGFCKNNNINEGNKVFYNY